MPQGRAAGFRPAAGLAEWHLLTALVSASSVPRRCACFAGATVTEISDLSRIRIASGVVPSPAPWPFAVDTALTPS